MHIIRLSWAVTLVNLKSPLFWDIVLHRLMMGAWCLATVWWSNHQQSKFPMKKLHESIAPLKWILLCCMKMLGKNHQWCGTISQYNGGLKYNVNEWVSERFISRQANKEVKNKKYIPAWVMNSMEDYIYSYECF